MRVDARLLLRRRSTGGKGLANVEKNKLQTETLPCFDKVGVAAFIRDRGPALMVYA